MGTTMDNSSCEWVRGRLPLCMGPSADLTDPDAGGGDLSVEDGQAIERHLGSCPGCRALQTGLSLVLEALTAAAGSLPVVPDAPSLWPALERRIAAQHGGGDSQTPRARSADAGAAPTWAWAALDDERPLRSAWMQDTLREVAQAVGLGALSDRTSGTGRGRAGRSPRESGGSWRVVGVGLAASIVAVLVMVPLAWRQQSDARATIRANAVPVERFVVPMVQVEDKTPAVDHLDLEKDRDSTALARLEPTKPPADPPSSADATAEGKSAPSTRFDHDLELGTPMPPDGRDSKPIY
jgi:hypothetical protein